MGMDDSKKLSFLTEVDFKNLSPEQYLDLLFEQVHPALVRLSGQLIHSNYQGRDTLTPSEHSIISEVYLKIRKNCSKQQELRDNGVCRYEFCNYLRRIIVCILKDREKYNQASKRQETSVGEWAATEDTEQLSPENEYGKESITFIDHQLGLLKEVNQKASEAFAFRIYLKLKNSEIADVMGVNERTVERLISDAKKSISQAIAA